MKIAACVGVKDEAELIGHTIDHLRAIGVDHVITCDMGSSDGTEDILESFRAADFVIIRTDDVSACPEEFQRMYGAAVASAVAEKVDWLLFQDADEYWIPATGNLRECASLRDADLLSVDRFHVPLVRGCSVTPPPVSVDSYDNLLLVIKSVPNFRDFMQDNPTAPWILGVPVPKIMVRPSLVASLTQAGHDAVAVDGVVFRRSKPADLIIAHLPFSTPARFARKIENIRRNMQAHDEDYKGDAAWHWRRWIALADQEGINAEFERSSFDPSAIERLRREGIVRSAAEVFKAMLSSG